MFVSMRNDRAVVSMHPIGEEDKMKMARTSTVAFRTHCCARRTLHEVQQRFYKDPDVEMQTEPSSSGGVEMSVRGRGGIFL